MKTEVHYEDFMAFHRTVSFQEVSFLMLWYTIIIEYFDREFPRRVHSLLHDQMVTHISAVARTTFEKVRRSQVTSLCKFHAHNTEDHEFWITVDKNLAINPSA
jgi:hypothetical protein